MKLNKFTAFFNIDIFKKNKTFIGSPEISPKKVEHNSEIQIILNTKNKKGLEIFIKSETKFDKYEIETILFNSDRALIHQLDSVSLDILMQNNAEVLKECFMERIKSFANIVSHKIIENNYSSLIINHNYDIIVSNYENTIKLFASPFGEKLFDNDIDKVFQLYSLAFKISNNIKEQIDSYEFASTSMSVMNFKNKHEKNFIKVIVPLYNKLKEEKLLNVSKNNQIFEMDALKISILNSLTDKVNSFDINSFSSKAQETFKAINEICDDLEVSKKSFTITQFLNFENIVNKRIPQVIQEYITIPEKYRKHLKHIEDSPESLLEDSLLEDSLNEIKNNLTSMIEEIQINNIQTMKKSNVYLKSISL